METISTPDPQRLKHHRSITPCQSCASPLTHSIIAKLVRCPVCRHVNPVTSYTCVNNLAHYDTLDAFQVKNWTVEGLKSYLVSTGTLEPDALKWISDFRVTGDQFLKITERDMVQWDLSDRSTRALLEHAYTLSKTSKVAPHTTPIVSQIRLDMKTKELKAAEQRILKLQEGQVKYLEQQKAIQEAEELFSNPIPTNIDMNLGQTTTTTATATMTTMNDDVTTIATATFSTTTTPTVPNNTSPPVEINTIPYPIATPQTAISQSLPHQQQQHQQQQQQQQPQ